MGDEIYCPDCGDGLQSFDKCVCGWRRNSGRPDSKRCSYVFHGEEKGCHAMPVIFRDGNWYCREHVYIANGQPKKSSCSNLTSAEEHMDKIYALLGKKHLSRKRTQGLLI